VEHGTFRTVACAAAPLIAAATYKQTCINRPLGSQSRPAGMGKLSTDYSLFVPHTVFSWRRLLVTCIHTPTNLSQHQTPPRLHAVVHDTIILTLSRADLTRHSLPPHVYNYDVIFMSASCRMFAVLCYTKLPTKYTP
jgi:hypothetical protein